MPNVYLPCSLISDCLFHVFCVLFRPCYSHAQVLSTLLHEFIIFYSHTVWNLLLSWYESALLGWKLHLSNAFYTNYYSILFFFGCHLLLFLWSYLIIAISMCKCWGWYLYAVHYLVLVAAGRFIKVDFWVSYFELLNCGFIILTTRPITIKLLCGASAVGL